MSILILPTSEDEARILAFWGYKFAEALDLPLIVLSVFSGSSQESEFSFSEEEPSGNAILGAAHSSLLEFVSGQEDPAHQGIKISFRDIPSLDPRGTVFEQIRSLSTRIVLAVNQSRNADNPKLRLLKELFNAAPCDLVLLRFGSAEIPACGKILVAASTGPNIKEALPVTAALAEKNDSLLTVLYAQQELGSESVELGKLKLKEILKEASVLDCKQIEGRIVISNNPSSAIKKAAQEDFDLCLIGASNMGGLRRALFSTVPDRLLGKDHNFTLAIFRAGRPVSDRVINWFNRWFEASVPQLSRQERLELFKALEGGSTWHFDYAALLVLSTAIATFGLIQNSTAVVIGAMLVAPLMTPLIASGLALLQGNLRLTLRASITIFFSFLIALAIGFLISLAFPLSGLTGELAARGGPTIIDMAIGFLSGIAAAYCLARPNLSAALPGVAIAAALVPPIATVGASLAIGEIQNGAGAALLFATNIVAIVLGASFSFFACGAKAMETSSPFPLWVKRTMIGLIVAALLLAIPLGR